MTTHVSAWFGRDRRSSNLGREPDPVRGDRGGPAPAPGPVGLGGRERPCEGSVGARRPGRHRPQPAEEEGNKAQAGKNFPKSLLTPPGFAAGLRPTAVNIFRLAEAVSSPS